MGWYNNKYLGVFRSLNLNLKQKFEAICLISNSNSVTSKILQTVNFEKLKIVTSTENLGP